MEKKQVLYLEGNIWVSVNEGRPERIASGALCLDGSSPTVSKDFLHDFMSVISLKLLWKYENL